MNLIEQLGGYKKAKRELELKEQGSVLQCCVAVTVNMIQDALLEHRRQHNIYEPDDWIIYDDELMVFAMWSKHHNEYAYIGYANTDDGALEHRSKFRHATDAEIAQGYRDE